VSSTLGSESDNICGRSPPILIRGTVGGGAVMLAWTRRNITRLDVVWGGVEAVEILRSCEHHYEPALLERSSSRLSLVLETIVFYLRGSFFGQGQSPGLALLLIGAIAVSSDSSVFQASFLQY
jgi:hypothetical protein